MLLNYRYLVGDRRRFNFSLVRFKPNPIVVCSDPREAMRSRSSFKDDNSVRSICLEYSELTRRRFSMTREVIVGLTAVGAVMVKPPSRRVWPDVRAALVVILSLITRRAINPAFDVTAELSMKAPMSVSKPADLG